MSKDEKAGIRSFKESISASDPWGPPIDVLGELYESIGKVNAAPLRDLRIPQVECAAKAAMAWLSELRGFVIAALVQQFEESKYLEDLAHTEQFQALPRKTREILVRSQQSADKLTAESIEMFLRIWGEYPDVPITRGAEVFLPCPSHDLARSTDRYLEQRSSAS
ncbi:Uncharacterised protein [Mycobacteroides abscessus subsp. abscessus]|uniref:hypothetical protein n=1 Tax=Mycobacteroides abscessus TaxID=36809 RepID=UPI0009A5A6EC|nr:hypothetical protein [Mycobacteroides abscessus]SKU63675.1 Uncharacterised protein [Mycobacteroides abscessus subsp. abscessus]